MSTGLSRPLFALTRNSLPELLIHGAYVIKPQGQDCVGDEDFSFYVGSLLSPWQFLAADIAEAQAFWSLGIAFHSGQNIHLQALAQIAKIAEAGEEELICPREFPLDWELSARLKISHRKPLRMHHPCSGKHLVMLAACHKFGYQKDLYWETDHPLQKKIFNLIGKEAGQQVYWINDTCGVPSFFMPARVHLGMWERFALDEGEKAAVIKDLWLQNPRLVGGRGRLDSDLTLAANCKALVKESGNGDILVQSLADGSHPATSILIKLSSGHSKRYLALALLVIIRKNPWLPPIFHELREYLHSRLDEWVPREFKMIEML